MQTINQTVSIKELRDNLAQIIEEVAIAKKHIEVTKFGKAKAMIVPMKDTEKPKKRESGLSASFGAWKDRKDIKNTAQWVARLRHRMSNRYEKISG